MSESCQVSVQRYYRKKRNLAYILYTVVKISSFVGASAGIFLYTKELEGSFGLNITSETKLAFQKTYF